MILTLFSDDSLPLYQTDLPFYYANDMISYDNHQFAYGLSTILTDWSQELPGLVLRIHNDL